MGIGLSNGAFYKDEMHYAASQWDDKYDDNVITPSEMQTNKQLDKSEIDPSTGVGIEVGYKTGYPGMFNKLLYGDNPALPEISVGGPTGSSDPKDISKEDLDKSLDIAMSSGPGIIAGAGKGGVEYMRNAIKATTMQNAGKTADEIYQATGMFKDKGVSQWKREISDEGMKLVDRDWKYGDKGKLSDFVDHPKLFEEYPHLKDLDFKVADKDYPYLGGFNSAEKSITINPDKIRAGDEGILDVLSHELQHAVQAKAGFPQGSNPDRALEDVGYALRGRMLEAAGEGDKHTLSNLIDLYKDIQDNASKFGTYMYQRVPGEVEANNVMARRKLTDEQRKMFSPSDTQKFLEGSENSMTGGTYYPPFHYP